MNAATVADGTLALPLRVAEGAALRVSLVDDAAAFCGLRDEWNRLLEASRSDGFFLTWAWLHTWWRHLAGDARLAILTVRRGAQLVAVAPFLSRAVGGSERLGLRRIEFMGAGRVGSDYLDLIVLPGAEGQAIAACADWLTRRGLALDLRQVRLRRSAAAGLLRALRGAGFRIGAQRTHRCPFIDLRGRSWQGYLEGLGSEHRYNFQRRLRKLESQHRMRFERVVSEPRRRELLPVLFELHRLRWKERGGSDGLEGSGIRAFHGELTRLALERGWLRLFVLWLGESPAAALYGFRYRDVFYFYQSGFDPRFHKLSVGLVTMGLAIKSAVEEGAAEFDLLHGDEPYKFHWAKSTRRLARVAAYPPDLFGRLAWSAAAARGAARRLLRRLPPAVAAKLSAARERGRSDVAPGC